MTDLSTLTDRDILVRLDQSMGFVTEDIRDLKERVTTLERAEDRRSGFLGGAKWMWAFFTALPSGVIGFLIASGGH